MGWGKLGWRLEMGWRFRMGKIKIIFNTIVSIMMAVGFMVLYAKGFNDTPTTIALMTLPLLVGSILVNDNEYRRNGLWLVFSSLFMIIGFLLLFGNIGSSNYTYIIFINIGAFIFSMSLLNLFEKVSDELGKPVSDWIDKKQNSNKLKNGN